MPTANLIRPVRVIASTSLRGNLAAEAKLRPELYYRLSVVPLQLPPLRERKEDLPELAEFFADRLAKRHQLANDRFLRRCISDCHNITGPGTYGSLRMRSSA